MDQSFGEILGKTYWGNTISEWVISFTVILCSFLFAKFVYHHVLKLGRRLVAKTETRLDDIIFDMLEKPAGILVAVGGSYFGYQLLKLPDSVSFLFDKSFYFVFVFWTAWVIDRVVNALIEEFVVPFTEKTETDLDDQLLPIARRGLKVMIWAMAVIIGVNNAGYDVGAVLAGLGIGGLAFALAAQDTVSNLFGGITIFLDKPFKINDRVVVDGHDGVVADIGIRSTRLRTLSGRIVTIPNSRFSDKPLENISSEPSRKIIVNLGLTYDTTADQIEEGLKILEGIVQKTDLVTDDCYAYFGSFGDFALGLTLIYYIKTESPITEAMTVMNLAILREFNSAGLEMAFPTQTLHHIHPQGEATGVKAA